MVLVEAMMFPHAPTFLNSVFGKDECVTATEHEPDQRRHPRYDIELEGTLHWRGETMPCRVRNISAGGALIKVEKTLRPGHRVTVEIPEIGKMTGRVVRMMWKLVGISMEDGEAEIDTFMVEWLAWSNGWHGRMAGAGVQGCPSP
jgi:hypothetical protein